MLINVCYFHHHFLLLLLLLQWSLVILCNLELDYLCYSTYIITTNHSKSNSINFKNLTESTNYHPYLRYEFPKRLHLLRYLFWPNFRPKVSAKLPNFRFRPKLKKPVSVVHYCISTPLSTNHAIPAICTSLFFVLKDLL